MAGVVNECPRCGARCYDMDPCIPCGLTGQIWVHRKTGGHYYIEAAGKFEDTGVACVVYRSLATGEVWVRSLKNFTEWLADGPRFTRVEKVK